MINKIAFFRAGSSISALEQYRIFGPLTNAGIQVLEGIKDGKVDREVIYNSDIVLFQRDFSSHFDWYLTLINYARELRRPVILDLDDDLFALPIDHPDRISTYYAGSLPALLHAILNVDGVTVTTKLLRESIQNLNPNVWILPNYFDDQLWQFRPGRTKSPDAPVTIFYMGTPTHQPDLHLISPSLFRLAEEFGSAIKFFFYGIEPPEGLEGLTSVTFQPVQTFDYVTFVSYMNEIQADLAIAPLCDNSFNRSKSAIKFFEYTAMGIPGVYADMAPYSSVVRDGYNGMLAQTTDQWCEKIRLLIKKPKLRNSIIRNAQESVKKEWLIGDHSSEWLDVYKKINDTTRESQVNRSDILESLEMIVIQQRGLQKRQEIINSLNEKYLIQSCQLAEMKENVTSLEQKLSDKRSEIEETKKYLSSLLLSRSRTITRPLRKLGKILRRQR